MSQQHKKEESCCCSLSSSVVFFFSSSSCLLVFAFPWCSFSLCSFTCLLVAAAACLEGQTTRNGHFGLLWEVVGEFSQPAVFNSTNQSNRSPPTNVRKLSAKTTKNNPERNKNQNTTNKLPTCLLLPLSFVWKKEGCGTFHVTPNSPFPRTSTFPPPTKTDTCPCYCCCCCCCCCC